MTNNLIWDELSLEVFIAARSGMAVKDFEIQCRLAPFTNGKSFFDRIRVAETLINEKLIYIEDGYLRINIKSIPDSLIDKLKSGSELAWKILEYIDPPNKLLDKLDLDLLHKIGFDGEQAVIRELKKILSEKDYLRVKHISLLDDSAGFDIQAPSTRSPEDTLFLEVKTSVRPGDLFTFYISKNEARVGGQNDNWSLVGVESTIDGLRVLGYLSFNSFSDLLPLNQSNFSEWETAKVVISKKMFINGVP
jgi:hypothetical protein